MATRNKRGAGRRALSAAVAFGLAAMFTATGNVSAHAAPLRYFKYASDASIFALYGDSTTKCLTLAEYRAAGHPSFGVPGKVPGARYVKYANAATVYVVLAGQVIAITFPEYQAAGSPGFGVPGKVPGARYFTFADSPTIYVALGNNVTALTYAEWVAAGRPAPGLPGNVPGMTVWKNADSATVYFTFGSSTHAITPAEWASAGRPAPQLRGTTSYTPSATIRSKFSNGNVPESEMSQVAWDPIATWPSVHKMLVTKRAYVDLANLNAAFKARFGVDLLMDDAYRSYADQVKARAQYGTGAAVPGTSNHGWGLAVDLLDHRVSYPTATERNFASRMVYGGDMHSWLDANAPAYGWDDRVRNEPWHWEYTR